MSKTAVKPVSRKSNLVTQELEKEILTYDLVTDKAFSLNETSAIIWTLCDGNRTIAEIADLSSQKLKSPISEDFVWFALEQLKKENLLADETEINAPFGDLSRRDVIRRIGFASLAVLPVVASLVAPTAMQAASNCSASSGRGLNCSCTAITQCQPPSSRCCTSVPGNPRTCQPSGLVASGDPCGVNCDCASGTCLTGAPRVCQ